MTEFERVSGSTPYHRPFYFGNELAMNMYGCDAYLIRNSDALRTYARECVQLLKMKAYGDPILNHFGHASVATAGYTLTQLIETSLISGHFSEFYNSAYINIFSCQPYDAKLAREHAAEFFKAQHVSYWELSR